ncbi:MAG: hydrogenase iron-sulfur subunit [Verrucomicrobia bacterium]|nr:hydrogenase iron-sulfur subunit [Verrucomicrobiota bacterium]
MTETSSMLDRPTGGAPSVTPLTPSVRGEALLRCFENLWLRLDRLTENFLPAALNPFGQLGAIANTCLIAAVVSGIALLIWYTPSVTQAYDSLEKLRAGSWLGQLVRSLHRYSSDGCIFFILLHAARIVSQRRFTGARWIAWVTGILMLAALWFIGWTGYWLVWDVRAQHAALGTARFIDQLPIFAEPMSRSFLTDESVPSLLFFLIFFAHMLLPLSIGIGLWLHLMRVNRARLLTGRAMTLWIIGSLIVVSMLLPATSASPAQMTVKAQRFTIDWWYLWPVGLTDRLGGGALWAFFLGTGLLTLAAPWWMARRRLAPEWKAEVDLSRCFGCTLCSKDCPFNAITMVAREDGKAFEVQSHIDPALCVGCGVCTGACDSQAINLPALDSRALEKRLNAWIDATKARGEKPMVAYCCEESGAGHLRVNADGTSAELPGYRVERVPCVGWISAVMLERPLKRGVEGIMVIACGDADPVARDGCQWFEQRMNGQRQPAFDPGKADAARVRLVHLDRTRNASLANIAREFRANPAGPKTSAARRHALRVAGGLGLAIVLGAVTWLFSNLPYRTPHSPEPELVVSFNHHGAIVDARKLTKEELAKRLPHMRAQVNVTRERVPVRLRVQVDGQTVHDRSYQSKGLSHDGPSMAVVRLPVTRGPHTVTVELADTADTNQLTLRWSEQVEFKENHQRVVLFDTKAGFSLH